MLIEYVELNDFLSFAESGESFALQPLNIFIGANGSGKSNFLEVFDLLKSTPDNLSGFIRSGGFVSDWIFKGQGSKGVANVKVGINGKDIVNAPNKKIDYCLEFDGRGQGFEIRAERLSNTNTDPKNPYLYYDVKLGYSPVVNVRSEKEGRKLQREDLDMSQSVLKQLRDPLNYPELRYVSQKFSQIRIYREWAFGRDTPARNPQRADLPNVYLEPDCSNLGLVLNHIGENYTAKVRLLSELKKFYKSVLDYTVRIDNGTVQVLFQEEGLTAPVPVTRLSDGTLRYLCLLAILCNPSQPPLICIEEPELGLHPDILPGLAELLREAAEKTQLIVTTHSSELVSSFTDTPEVIVVVEKENGATYFNRLEKDELEPWLEEYSLGELWRRGDIGGNRW